MSRFTCLNFIPVRYPVQVPGGTSIPQWAFQQAVRLISRFQTYSHEISPLQTGGKFNMTVAYNEAAAGTQSLLSEFKN